MKSLKDIVKIVEKTKEKGKTVGMLTGNFDVLHINHIKLFNAGKSAIDILIVGVDSNEIAAAYREPEAKLVNSLERRCEILDNIKTIDHVFPIESDEILNSSEEVHEFHVGLAKKISPTHIIANPLGDKYIDDRRNRCKQLGIELLEFWISDFLDDR